MNEELKHSFTCINLGSLYGKAWYSFILFLFEHMKLFNKYVLLVNLKTIWWRQTQMLMMEETNKQKKKLSNQWDMRLNTNMHVGSHFGLQQNIVVLFIL